MNDLFASLDTKPVNPEREQLPKFESVNPHMLPNGIIELIKQFQQKELTFLELVHKVRDAGFDSSNLYWQVEKEY